MRHLLKSVIVLAMSSFLAFGAAGVVSASPLPQRAVSSSVIYPSCYTVPVPVITAGMGVSMVQRSANPFDQIPSQINGKTVTLDWQACTFFHPPYNTAMNSFTLYYLTESTAAQAMTYFNELCASMHAIASNWSTPALGSGACVEGHGGGMTVAGAYMAVDNVVVQIFGALLPAQATALLQRIAPLVAAAKGGPVPGSGVTLPGTTTGATGVRVTSLKYSVTNGSVPVTLMCQSARCSGVAELRGTAGILARSRYNIHTATRPMVVKMALTAPGALAFANASVMRVPVTLQVTVKGGPTTTKMISIS